MRLSTIAFLAAMLPLGAAAEPNRNDQKTDKWTEVDTFEFSTSQDGRLGMTVIGLNNELRAYFGAPKDAGLLVAHVAPNGPAALAGVRVGDIVTRFGNDRVQSAFDMVTTVAKHEMAEKLGIEVIRDRKPLTLQVTLNQRREAPTGSTPT